MAGGEKKTGAPRLLGRVIEGAAPAPFAGFIEPCCPTPRKAPQNGDGWPHEIDLFRLFVRSQLKRTTA